MLIFTLLIAPMFIYLALVTVGDFISLFRVRPKSVELTEIEKREQERYEWLNSGSLRY